MLVREDHTIRSSQIQGPTPNQLVETLRQQIAQMEGARRPQDEVAVSSGCEPLDRLLPARGFRRGTLAEWLAPGDGCGAASLALLAAREACGKGGALVLFDQAREFYPPAAVRLGIEPENLIVVQPGSAADHVWALDQALRCPGVGAALAWPEKLDSKTFRRLQLAAEQGGGLGFLLREERARQEPSWADVRLLIRPLPVSVPGAGRRLRVELLRGHGGGNGGSIEVEFNDETRTVHLAPQLARATTPRRAAGA